jgi:acyl-coenzyme A thioesterase PaaI-like protein
LIGLSNALSPPIELRAGDDLRTVHGRAVFGSAYEGPPGCVHGGYVAAAFDEVLGFANSLSGTPGMTGTLTVRYRRPTPLHTELRFEGRYDRSEGRKIFTTGQLFAGETLCAEADGLFISVDFERFRGLFEERQKRDQERERS